MKIKKARAELARTTFEHVNDDDISASNFGDTEALISKFDSTTRRFRDIQSNCTTKEFTHKPSGISTHPWAFDSCYQRLFQAKVAAKKAYLNDNSMANKNKLKLATTVLYEAYNDREQNYYKQLVSSSSGDYRDFFTLMRTK